jgi:glucosamine-6-phosphate deaminase
MPKPIRQLKLAGADVKVYDSSVSACEEAAETISSSIQIAARTRGKAVLGLATGATPEPVYARLVENYRGQTLSFEDVSTYNLDEYYPMGPLDPKSYHFYMEQRLFGHVNVSANRAHVLDGTVPEAFVDEHAAQFDRWIDAEGGLDLQLLGLGRNGHIGFNEPSDLSVDQAVALRTRLVELHPTTIADAAWDFGGVEFVPRRALTMGVASILAARSIMVLVFGERKAPAVAKSLQGPITAGVPGSLLRTVSDRVTWLIDGAAASELL